MRNDGVNGGHTKTGSLISYRLSSKVLQGITQRFLHYGRNDGRREITLDRKKRTLVNEANRSAVFCLKSRVAFNISVILTGRICARW